MALQEALGKVQQETANEINRLQHELEEKNKILEDLQKQLDEQQDYEDIKKHCQLLKKTLNPGSPKDETPPVSEPDLGSSLIDKQQQQPQQPKAAAGEDSSKENYDMFMLQRVKALQQVNPALKALIDLQAITSGQNPWMKHPGLLQSLPNVLKAQGGLLPNMTPPTSTPFQPFLPGSPLPPSPTKPPAPFDPIASIVRRNSLSPVKPDDVMESPATTPLPPPIPTTPITNGSSSTSSKPRSDDGIKSPPMTAEPQSQSPRGVPPPPPSTTGSFMSGGRIPKFDPLEGKLQDMLRYNMERYGGQAFDTLATARRVREILSVHNIGQRLFAKYVLGLSQGTVSELLSKPKSWEKLTEKGRDSYRKMHAWVYDEGAVMMLKSLIPRKSELVRSGAGPPGAPGAPTPPFPTIGAGGPREKDIFERQSPNFDAIAKSIMSGDRRFPANPFDFKKLPDKMEDSFVRDPPTPETKFDPPPTFRSGLFPGFGLPTLTDLMDRENKDMQRALNIYQMELSKIHQKAMAATGTSGGGSDAGDGRTSEPAVSPVPKSIDENSREGCDDSDNEDKKATSLPGAGPPPPAPFPVLGFPADLPKFPVVTSVATPGMVSPLQQIASITNSLSANPGSLGANLPFPRPGGSQQKPFKNILPPIHQAQLDRYDSINTEEVVRQVKDMLSSYSISQRLFGESVLGLSQGSVSDLLARPKPYHMLTQKGKEPFIRMKLFLEDETAIHRLVASQYKIAPDRLMRTGAYTGNPGDKLAFPGGLSDPATLLHGLPPPPSLISGTASGLRFPFGGAGGAGGAGTRPGAPLDPFSLVSMQRKLSMAQPGAGTPLGPAASDSPQDSRPSQQNMYEMATMQNEVNTHEMVVKVKGLLAENNIAQKVFGRVVLGLSQGSVSEIMNKPKPWHMLSIKGREPYIRMQLWLEDPLNVEKLKQAKMDGLEGQTIDLSKRLEANTFPHRGVLTAEKSPLHEKKDDVVVDDDEGPTAAKRPRVMLSEQQKEALRAAFAVQPFPNPMFVECFAKELGMEPHELNGLISYTDAAAVDRDAEEEAAKSDEETAVASAVAATAASRPSKRKPAAPQWVNPEHAQQLQEQPKEGEAAAATAGLETKDNDENMEDN